MAGWLSTAVFRLIRPQSNITQQHQSDTTLPTDVFEKNFSSPPHSMPSLVSYGIQKFISSGGTITPSFLSPSPIRQWLMPKTMMCEPSDFVTHQLFVKEELKNKKLLLAHPLTLKTNKVFHLKCENAVKNTMGFAEIKNWLINSVFSN